MRVLLDFHRATSGSASVLGLDCRSESMEVRRRTGYLSGDIALYEKGESYYFKPGTLAVPKDAGWLLLHLVDHIAQGAPEPLLW